MSTPSSLKYRSSSGVFNNTPLVNNSPPPAPPAAAPISTRSSIDPSMILKREESVSTTKEEYTPPKKQSKAPYIIIAVVVGVIIAAWLIFLFVVYFQRRSFFAYQRPAKLPGQVGDTIVPTSAGYNIPPTGTLAFRTIMIGGPIQSRPEQERFVQEANSEADQWREYQG